VAPPPRTPAPPWARHGLGNTDGQHLDAQPSPRPARRCGDVGLHVPACGGSDGERDPGGRGGGDGGRRPAGPVRDHRRHARGDRGPARPPARQPARLVRRPPSLHRAGDRHRRHGLGLGLGSRLRRPVLRAAGGRPLLGRLQVRPHPRAAGRARRRHLGALCRPHQGRRPPHPGRPDADRERAGRQGDPAPGAGLGHPADLPGGHRHRRGRGRRPPAALGPPAATARRSTRPSCGSRAGRSPRPCR
jgi:hypothetical protein